MNGPLASAEESPVADSRTRLVAWQQRLHEHFTKLAASRRDAGWPVFALEHGLSSEELDALFRDIRTSGSSGPSRDVCLPWIVYSSEIGYAYSGYEYWQTFEAETPGWQYSWRERIRARFERFAQDYNGIRPEGNWAGQFTIIAWPITHGLLPRDLQRQLAALLHDASMSFQAATFASAEALGVHLQRRCYGCSSRFQQFAENAVLLGHIAMALLLQEDDADDAETAILNTATLHRIVHDLSQERDARQWLAGARSAARFRVRGLARVPLRGREADPDASKRRGRDGEDELPRAAFLLRQTADDRWSVRVQFPNLAHLLTRFPRARDVLMKSQARVGGATGRLLARGRIVSDSSTAVALDQWPTPGVALLRFEGAPPELASVLDAAFHGPSGDQWLFSIGTDEMAREVATRVVSAGSSYILLQRTEVQNPVGGLGIHRIEVACAGVFGIRLDIPKAVTDTLVAVLGVLNLEVAQSLDVWAVGLPPAAWTGAGRAEWIEGHPITLAVRADRRIKRLELSIDRSSSTILTPSREQPLGAPVFVALPALPAGPHRLSLVADTVQESEGRAAPTEGLNGELEFEIRQARPALTGHVGPLSFAVLPSSPSLEDLWEDRVEVHVANPGKGSIACRLVLSDRTGRELFARTCTLPSPCESDTWRRAFAPIRKDAEQFYDDAQLCLIEYDAGSRGRARILAERDFTPLRWAVRDHGRKALLIDSQGRADMAIESLRCTVPALRESHLAMEAVLKGLEIDDEGALVLARTSDYETATVLVPSQRLRGFAALAPHPDVPHGPRTVATIIGLAQLAALWERARLAGSRLAGLRRTSAVEALVSRLTGIIAGGRWEAAEALLVERGLEEASRLMKERVAIRPDEKAIALLLSERLPACLGAPLAEAEAMFADVLQPYVKGLGTDELPAFALRLAASPRAAEALVAAKSDTALGVKSHGEALVEGLLDRPVVMRAARYAVVETRASLLDEHADVPALPWRME